VCQLRADSRPEGCSLHGILPQKAQPTGNEVFRTFQPLLPHPVAEHERRGERWSPEAGVQQFPAEAAQQHQREERPGGAFHTQPALTSALPTDPFMLKLRAVPPSDIKRNLSIGYSVCRLKTRKINLFIIGKENTKLSHGFQPATANLRTPWLLLVLVTSKIQIIKPCTPDQVARGHTWGFFVLRNPTSYTISTTRTQSTMVHRNYTALMFEHLPTFHRNSRATQKNSSNNDSLPPHDGRSDVLQLTNAEALTMEQGL
ncbi:hypothetical protein AVEN_189429-1, partial [Araneus ventricosus]